MTFDAWEVELRLPEDYLMHWGIRGMKHGHRRYQNEDGTWTEAGLEARRKREGFGNSREERKAARKVRKTERAMARAERHQARKEAREQVRKEFAEKRRQRTVSKLTDAELKARIERVKMEQEYRELTRSPLLKTGEKLVASYLQNRSIRAERAYQAHQTKLSREHEMAKLKEETAQIQKKTEADKARAEADKARANADAKRADTDKLDIEKGTRLVKLKNERRSLKLQNKHFRSNNTILGGLRKFGNKVLSGKGDGAEEYYRAIGESEGAYYRGKKDAKIAIKQNRMLTRRNRKLYPYEEKAAIRESGQNYWAKKEKDKNNGKGKGKGNQNS